MVFLFGDKLKEIRKKSNIKQEELGKFLNVGATTISNWENNVSQPTIEQIIEIAKEFGVSVDYLFGLTNEDTTKIQELNRVAREAGLIVGEDMTMEEFKKAIDIIKILENQKDTN